MDCSKCSYMKMPHAGGHCYMFKDPPGDFCAQLTIDGKRQGPEPGTLAFTAKAMAQMSPVEGDPDFWDRWKDEMKEALDSR